MDPSEEHVVDAAEMDWQRTKTGLMRKSLVELPDGPSARLVRIEPGQVVPRHTHPCNEIMYILEGDLDWDGRSHGSGACYYKPKGCFYGPLTTKGGATVLLFFDGRFGFQE